VYPPESHSSIIQYPSQDGTQITAYFSRPAAAGRSPGVIVIMEAFGLIEHIKDVARRFAEQGYLALAPDLYTRQGSPDPGHMDPVLQTMFSVPDAQAVADLEGAITSLYISRLITVEVASAFAVKTRTGELDERDFVPLLRRFLRDVAQRQFQALRMTNAHYEAAVELLEKYVQRRLRTLDALHLAVASDLRRRGILDHFVCADESLCSITTEEGLSTLTPAQP
jgi:predicted nucleic acid-binding protein